MARGAKPGKAKGESKRPVARKSPKNEGSRVRDLEKRLAEALKDKAEALEQQTATAEILRVISNLPSDYQPVFDTIVRSAGVVCGAADAILWIGDGDELVVHAHHGPLPARIGARQPIRGSVAGYAVHEARVIHIEDVTESDDFPVGRDVARRLGWRTVLSAPLLRGGLPIGAILIRRREVRPFTESQIKLLETFADQAVIAIENVRLFRELEARNKDLGEALQRQTAAADILRAISQAQTDAQPVFEAIADSAMRLFGAWGALVWQCDRELLRLAAARGGRPGSGEAILERWRTPRRPDADSLLGRTVHARAMQQIIDVETDPSVEAVLREGARERGWRSTIQVPMLQGEDVVGVIGVSRVQPGRFAPAEVALLQTFADQAVIAIENVRLFTELQASNRELTTALDTQTATSDILRVISRSQTDVQPVFDAIVSSAVRLLGAYAGSLTRVAGDQLEFAALTSTDDAGDAALRARFPQSLHSEEPHPQAIRARVPLNIADAHTDPRLSEAVHAYARVRGFRSQVVVPLLHHDDAVGTIGVVRREPGGFTDDEIALLKTFADQAVIAIENVRLFTELQMSNRDLTTALDTQTATSDILRVISRSQTDVQPVFDTIVRSAVRLCHAAFAGVALTDGKMIYLPANYGSSPEALAAARARYPRPLDMDTQAGMAILTRSVVHEPDTEEPSVATWVREMGRLLGLRSLVTVPMMREGEAVGAITVARHEAGRFPDSEVELLRTFADQAVIAIENVRLFTELQASNRELTTALDTQTATGDILRVISSSPTDVQPVFDAIVYSAVRLLRAYSGSLTRIVGDRIELAALTSTDDAGDAAVRARYPQPLQSEDPQAQTLRDRAPLNIADAQTDPRLPEATHAYARARGWRSAAMVPMLRHGEAVGTISVTRRDAGGFTDDEIALLKTFADQAVIAIENARLLTELQARTQELTRSVEQLTALGEVGRAVSSTLDLETVLTTIVSRAVELSGLDGGVVFEYDEDAQEFVQRAQAGTGGTLGAARRATRIRKGEGVVGRTAVTLEPVQVSDITAPGAYVGPNRENLIESGIRAIVAVPMVYEGRLIGSLGLTRNQPGDFPTETIELLQTFATQSALAIQNARLFQEIEDKSRQLEAASRHKSEFLANMSHELRTPLNAVIGFSEVLAEKMFGDINEKQAEYLQDILESGRHLLSLINDILDLSKIEAGRMELEAADFDLPSAIDNALILVRERATRHGITLGRHIDEHLGLIRGDERKVKQVLLNLLSNALKFTPEGGRIEVRATRHEGRAEVSVADTGVGIAPEDQAAVFEEFRQVGTADKKVEGTGLGLALSQKFVQLHGGRLWLESELGRGSTFTFTLPVS